MSRYPVGLTLSAQERHHLCAPARSGAQLVRSHTCQVTLPDGTPCRVTYTRMNGLSHQFDYGPPLSQRIWVMRRIEEGIPGVEESAVQHAAEAFQKAQEAEQKEMRRKTPPAGTPATGPTPDAPLNRAKADRFAGQYAVCLRFASGRLLRIGHAYDRAEDAQAELQAGNYGSIRTSQTLQLVIGICNRSARHWQEPRFLALLTEPATRPAESEPDVASSPETETVAAPDTGAATDAAFAQWMSEVEEILGEHTGMTTADLKHCRFRDWFEEAYTPEEAVREALGTNGYDDDLDEPFRRE